MTGYYVGAYAASPSLHAWRPELEEAFLDGLRELPGVEGYEHPFYGGVHRWDPEWFLRRLDTRRSLLLTCIPGTMRRLESEPAFGLASEDAEGRAAALRFTASAREAVARIADAAGRGLVTGVALHSAPARARARSSREALARSLEELASWDWSGAELLLEHCDAFVPEHPPEKGFLTLEQELWAIEDGAPGLVTVLLNWARSAIEARGPHGPAAHARGCRGLLRGLLFSGCCAAEHPVYGAWRDSHAPFAPAFGAAGEPASLLSAEAAREALDAAQEEGHLRFLGFKIQALPASLGVPERLALLRESLRILDGLAAARRKAV